MSLGHANAGTAPPRAPSVMPVVLSIAGSDPSGGAGIQADLKTFAAHGVYGAAAITALTAQNTLGVRGVHAAPAAFVVEQVQAVLDDLPVHAIKTGMLVDVDVVEAVAATIQRWQTSRAERGVVVVVDPVLIAKSGHALLAANAVDAVRTKLLPLATLVTPNRPEAEALVGFAVVDEASAIAAGRALIKLGAGAALLKGGHADGDDVLDILVMPATTTVPPVADVTPDVSPNGTADVEVHIVRTQRHRTRHTHGTGCTLSAAIAARLALGDALVVAVVESVRWVNEAIRTAPGLGGGHGPLNHFAPVARVINATDAVGEEEPRRG